MGDLSFKLHKAQVKIHKQIKKLPKSTREALIFCARQFGKSYLGCLMAIEDCIQTPGVQVTIIGPSIKQTVKICRPRIATISADAPKGLMVQTRSQNIWRFKNGSILTLEGFDTVLESMRGQTNHRVYMEETGTATADADDYEYMVHSVIIPTLMHAKGKLIHLTTPSKIVDHPLHTITLPKCKLNKSFYKFTIEDNPRLTKRDIAQEIEITGGIDNVACQRELYCEIVRDESIVVVPTFIEEMHVGEVALQDWYVPLVCGDFGGVNDLHCFHLIAYDHNRGRVVVLEEKWFPNRTPTSVIVDGLREWDTYSTSRVLDAHGQTQVDLAGLKYSTTVPIVKDSFDSTVHFIRDMFYRNQVLINPSCELLVETLRSGTFNKKRTDFMRTSTLGHLDALMSLVYGLRSVNKITDNRPIAHKEKVYTPERFLPNNVTKELSKL